MPLYLVEGEGPVGDVVSLDDMKEHLRVDHTDQDDLIQTYIDAIVAHLDGRDGILGRALHSQTWELKADTFGCWNGIIPLPPLIEVLSVKYYDEDAVLQTVAASVYQVAGVGGFQPARVSLAYGQTWPIPQLQRVEAVVIQFRAGYVDTDTSPDEGTVHASIIASIKLMVEDLYRFPGGSMDARFKANPAVMRLLGPLIVPHFA